MKSVLFGVVLKSEPITGPLVIEFSNSHWNGVSEGFGVKIDINQFYFSNSDSTLF
jgi:hypothetical protein